MRVPLSVLVAVIGIASMLVLTYTVRRPDGGVAVQAVALDDPPRPLQVRVRVRRFGTPEVVAAGRTDARGRLRLVLDQGRYAVEAQERRGRRDPEPVAVEVPEAAFATVTLEYGPRRR